MVEHAMYGSKLSVKELISRYNWLWKQTVGFVASYFHIFNKRRDLVFTTVFTSSYKVLEKMFVYVLQLFFNQVATSQILKLTLPF